MDQPARIAVVRRAIAHVAVQVAVAGGETDGILTQPTPGPRVVPPIAIVLQAGVDLVLAGRVQVAGRARVGAQELCVWWSGRERRGAPVWGSPNVISGSPRYSHRVGIRRLQGVLGLGFQIVLLIASTQVCRFVLPVSQAR